MSGHLDPAHLGDLKAAPATDVRHAHLRECARCRALLRAHDDFVGDAPPAAGARLAEAERALGDWIAREIGGVPRPAAPARRKWLDGWWAPAARPALALACAAAIAGATLLLMQARGPQPVVLRGAGPAARGAVVELLAPELVGGAVTLHWRAAREADAYRVRFFSLGLEEIGRAGPTIQTSITVPLQQAAPGARAGDAVLYRVIALARGDEIAVSALGTLRLR